MNYYFSLIMGCFFCMSLYSATLKEIEASIRNDTLKKTNAYLLSTFLSNKEYYHLIQIIAICGDTNDYIKLIEKIYKTVGTLHIKKLTTEDTTNLSPSAEGEKIIAHYRELDQDKSDVGYALIHDNYNVFSLFMKADNKKFLKRRGCDLAQSAVILGRIAMLKILLDQGISLDCTTGIHENSIWHSAAITQHDNSIEIFELLKKHYEKKTNEKLDISIKNNNEETPLMTACGNVCRYLRSEIVTYLLENKSDPNKIDIYKSTPLHRAALWDCPKIIQALLTYGAKPNALDRRNETPLHIACDHLNVKSAHNLIKHKKTFIDEINDDGDTPLHLLLHKKNLTSMDTIKRKNLVIFLLEAGARWDIFNKKGLTPLHYGEEALYLYKEKYLKRILHHNKEINWSLERDDTGDTLLHLLVKHNVTTQKEAQNITDSIQFLLENNASLTHKNKKNETPLSICNNLLANEKTPEKLRDYYLSINLIFTLNQTLKTNLKINLSNKTRTSLRKSLNKIE